MSRIASGARPANPYLFLILLVLVAMVTLFGLLLALESDEVRALIEENSVVEVASALGYFACLAAMALLGGWRFVFLKVPYMTGLVLVLGLRELDLDKRFTTMGIFKSRFYVSPEVGEIEKFWVLLLIVLLICAVVLLVHRHRRWFLPALRKFDPVAVSIALAAVLAGIAKAIDGLARKLDVFSLTLSERGYLLFQGVEEILELGIPLLLVLAVLAHFRPGPAYGDRP